MTGAQDLPWLSGRDRVRCSSEGDRGRQQVRGYLASETGCGLNIGVVHEIVSGYRNQEAERREGHKNPKRGSLTKVLALES
jgi:hypothetical protein